MSYTRHAEFPRAAPPFLRPLLSVIVTMADLKPPPPPQGERTESTDPIAETTLNLTLLDPSRWGWTAGGGVADLLPPHERARRKESKRSFLRSRRKRDRVEAAPSMRRKPPPAEAAAGVSTANGLNNAPMVIGEASTSMDSNKPTNGIPLQPLNASSIPVTSSLKPPPFASAATEDQRPESNPQPAKPAEKPTGPLRFKALADDGSLDIYAYHRGREGMEHRDEETGQLLCDVEATDTSHAVDAPKMTASVTVKFPLEDDNTAAAADSETETRYYRETVLWDLSDTQTLTPMLFAADIAENFGLSFVQTLELADSIQIQLNAFVVDNCGHAPPLALRDAIGQVRNAPASYVCDLYGEVTGLPNGGTCHPANQKARTLARTASIVCTSTGGKSGAKGKAPNKSRRISGSTPKAEEMYRLEVQKRLRAASAARVQQTCEATGIVEGPLEIRSDSVCHVCAEQQERCGFFACGSPSHGCCENHLRPWIDLSLPTSAVPSLGFCPVCSLNCDCAMCGQMLDLAALEFKKKTQEQETTPDLTTFDDLFVYCNSPELKQRATTATSGVPKGSTKRRQSATRPRVPKVPATEFPIEVCGGRYVDPGTARDYRVVYTEKGAFVPPQPEQKVDTVEADVGRIKAKPAAAETGSPLAEDGSVDYCQACRKHGNLLCCDFCPRAFHQACMKPEDIEGPSDAPWECPSCCTEKAGLPEHKIDGEKSITLVCAAFSKHNSTVCQEDTANIRIVTVVHEMVLALMEYDFGYVFSEPVDCSQIPMYRKLVKKPMDLGTIASNIINGQYFTFLSNEDKTWDDVILALLKDIELVWHNCFIYNYEGSAVHRMAEVQRRRWLMVRQQSFQADLSERVNRELASYVQMCERDRGKIARLGNKLSSGSQGGAKGRHTITVKQSSAKGCSLAVLDPDTGKLVKIYSTRIAAALAVDFLLGLGYKSEWEASSAEPNALMRKIARQSKSDTKCLLFGYRWVSLEDLKSGTVSFADKTEPTPLTKKAAPVEQQKFSIELVDGNHSYTFSTIEESLSFPSSPREKSAQLRERLNLLVPGDGFVEIEGTKWRIVPIKSDEVEAAQEARDKSKPVSDTAVVQNTAGDETRVVVKEDLLSGSELIFFQSVDSAYVDWLTTCEGSPMTTDEAKSMGAFQSSYLYGDRNVDGLIWKIAVKPPTAAPNRDATEGTENAQSQHLDGASKASASNENATALTQHQQNGETETVQSQKAAQDGDTGQVASQGVQEILPTPPTPPMQAETLKANGSTSPTSDRKRKGSTGSPNGDQVQKRVATVSQ